MSIKTKLSRTTREELEYPLLMQGIATNNVYFLATPSSGVQLHGMDKGKHFMTLHTFDLEVYHGSVTLTQE